MKVTCLPVLGKSERHKRDLLGLSEVMRSGVTFIVLADGYTYVKKCRKEEAWNWINSQESSKERSLIQRESSMNCYEAEQNIQT